MIPSSRSLPLPLLLSRLPSPTKAPDRDAFGLRDVEPSEVRRDWDAFENALHGLELRPGVKWEEASEQLGQVLSMARRFVDCIERRVLPPEGVSVYGLRIAYEGLAGFCTQDSVSLIKEYTDLFFSKCYHNHYKKLIEELGDSVGAAAEHPEQVRAGAAGATLDTAALPKVEGRVETFSSYGLSEEQVLEIVRAFAEAKGDEARQKIRSVVGSPDEAAEEGHARPEVAGGSARATHQDGQATPASVADVIETASAEEYSKVRWTEKKLATIFRGIFDVLGRKARALIERALDKVDPGGVLRTIDQLIDALRSHVRREGEAGRQKVLKMIDEETPEYEKRTLTQAQASRRIAERLKDDSFDEAKLYRLYKKGCIGEAGPDGRKRFSPKECDEFVPPPPEKSGPKPKSSSPDPCISGSSAGQKG